MQAIIQQLWLSNGSANNRRIVFSAWSVPIAAQATMEYVSASLSNIEQEQSFAVRVEML
jgi:hypothetical protein